MIRHVRPTLAFVVLSVACRAQPRVDPGMTYHPGGTLKITFAQPIDPDRTKVQAVFTGSASPVQALAVDSDRKGAEFLVPAGARIGPVRVTVAGSDLGAVDVPIVRATGVGGALNVFFEQLNTSFATYLAALAALGVLTMSILQAIKNLFYVRRLFQQKRMLWWLKTHAKEVQNNFDIVLCPCELEKEIVRIAADGNRRAFYDAELDDFIKELTAAALLIIDYSRYEDKDRKLAYSRILAVFASNASRRDFEILTGALPEVDKLDPKEVVEVQNRVRRLVLQSIGAFQLSTAWWWQSILHVSAFAISMLLAYAALQLASGGVGSPAGYMLSAALAAFLAPVARDLVAALQKLRS